LDRLAAGRQEIAFAAGKAAVFLEIQAAGEQIQLKGTIRRSLIRDAFPRHRHSGHWISSPANIFLASSSDSEALDDLRGTPILW